jgi:hypothetical protein
MLRNITLSLTIIILSLSLILCTSGKDNDDGNIEMSVHQKISKECLKAVNDYDGEISQLMWGNLVVTGNEPFTKLVFKTEKDKEGHRESYRIIDECTDELWDYQNMDLFIKGKVDVGYLESITGQKMKVLTLYPTSVYGKIWGK